MSYDDRVQEERFIAAANVKKGMAVAEPGDAIARVIHRVQKAKGKIHLFYSGTGFLKKNPTDPMEVVTLKRREREL